MRDKASLPLSLVIPADFEEFDVMKHLDDEDMLFMYDDPDNEMVYLTKSRNAELQEWELDQAEKKLFDAAKLVEWKKVYDKKKAVEPMSVDKSKLIREMMPKRIIRSKFALRWKTEDGKREARARLVGKGFEVRLSSEGAVLELRGVEALMASLREAMPEDFPPAAVEGVVESFNVDALTKQFEEEAELLPNAPVDLGDAWSNSVVVDLPGVGEMTTITDFTLKEIGGTRPDVATITYSVRTELEEGNTLLDGFDVTGSGSFHLDMEAGYVMDNVTEVRLTGQVQGMPMTVTSRTSMEQVLR